LDPDDLPEISYGAIDRHYARHLASVAPEEDGPIWMVNLMRYRDRAVYADGRASDLTGRQADDRYAPFGPMRTVGAELVFLSDVEAQPVGDDQEWERIAVVRYPSRRSFLDMQELPEYVALHEHKDAGMAATFVIGCCPVEPPALPDGALAHDRAPHRSAPEDGPVVLLHVLRDGAGAATDATDAYAGAWFEVEGTIVGDGRRWDQVRFEVFPSERAFRAASLDPERVSGRSGRRESADVDRYTMVLRPALDRITGSAGA